MCPWAFKSYEAFVEHLDQGRPTNLQDLGSLLSVQIFASSDDFYFVFRGDKAQQFA